MTGLLSRIEALRSPFMSAGVPGATTLRPGMWVNHDSKDCECCAADPTPLPAAQRTVIGT